MADKTNQRKAYNLLLEKEKNGETFTKEEVDAIANWKGETFKSYSYKLLKGIIHKYDKENFYVKGLIGITEDQFVEHLSQTAILKPKSQQLVDLLNEVDNNNIVKIVKSENIEILRNILEIVLKTENKQQLIDSLKFLFEQTSGTDREKLLLAIKDQNLTKDDIDILSGRKEGLEQFKLNLFNKTDWNEIDWQNFFESNTWIFGYGLDYKFLKILQREASVSNSTVGGEEEVFVDFLVGDKNFTILVELKKPDTSLFDNDKNRSGTWKLSKHLIFAVSQILEQKAEWQIKGQIKQYDKNRNEIKQKTIDPKVILVIGHTNQFSGDNLDNEIKSKTFELFRRNQKNIEIMTYDELYDRANFIVNQQ